jgi:8-oxo-dGTP pyrophosphatase MutT (NUDIX family)
LPPDAVGPPVRDAATVILLSRTAEGPKVLMGQRGNAAAFMPDKFVFPGGAVDPEDAVLPGEIALEPATARQLAADAPPGRPRRFDARFFLVKASEIAGDDLTASGEELAHLQWLDLLAARALSLPFITEVVLSELAALLAEDDPARPVPFFFQSAQGPEFRLLRA